MKTAIVGWRGMVGSVLMQRMALERDLDHVDPVFFSTSQAGGAGPVINGRPSGPAAKCQRPRGARAVRRGRDLPGRRLHERHPSEAACRRLARLLDRRGVRAAHEERRRHHSRPRESQRDRRRARGRRAGLRRRQLHRVADDDGPRRTVPRGPHRVDHVDDVPGGFGRRCAEHARTRGADGKRARCRSVAAARIRRAPFSTSTGSLRSACVPRTCRRRTSARRWRAA